MHCMVFEIQLFLIHVFQKRVVTRFHELGLYKSRKIAVAQEPSDV